LLELLSSVETAAPKTEERNTTREKPSDTTHAEEAASKTAEGGEGGEGG